jgi:tryptophanyl-tRNA synthetase
MKTKRVLSGIRATGRLHLGNYLGAVKGMLELQDGNEYETLYMVADAHTVTTPYNTEELRQNRREVILDYLAAGLNPEKSIIFQQAEVNEHFELAFYFSSVMSIARMQHLPTFKDKVKQYSQNSTMALLNYPVLMAADILVYKAGLVPVGIDQEPHLEVAREVARKMNELYGMDFPEPTRFATKGEYIPSLKGVGKMSKSVEGSYINLTDTPDEVKKKIRSIPTATSSGGEMNEGLKTLFTFTKLFMPDTVEQYENAFRDGTLKFVEIKDALAAAISADLAPLQTKRKQLEADPEYVNRVIQEGAEKARTIAKKTVAEVKNKMGLG